MWQFNQAQTISLFLSILNTELGTHRCPKWVNICLMLANLHLHFHYYFHSHLSCVYFRSTVHFVVMFWPNIISAFESCNLLIHFNEAACVGVARRSVKNVEPDSTFATIWQNTDWTTKKRCIFMINHFVEWMVFASDKTHGSISQSGHPGVYFISFAPPVRPLTSFIQTDILFMITNFWLG